MSVRLAFAYALSAALSTNTLAEERPKVDLEHLKPNDDLRAIVLTWGGVNLATAGWDNTNQNTFYPQGGLSWAAPYLSGLIALAYQVDPDADPQVLLKLLHDTGMEFANGGKLVNPTAFVEVVKEDAKKQAAKNIKAGG